MAFYRIQQANRDPQTLLNPDEQISTQWNDHAADDIRTGVSVCGDLDDLVEYFAAVGGWVEDCVLIELDGTPTEDRDHDDHLGALLIAPTRIVEVTPVPDEIVERIDTRQNEIWL